MLGIGAMAGVACEVRTWCTTWRQSPRGTPRIDHPRVWEPLQRPGA